MINFSKSSFPPVVKNILIINGIAWLAMVLLSNQGINLVEYFGLYFWKSTWFKPHQLVTYAFLHSFDITHLLFNMFAVWMFGRTLEQVWGSKRFLIYYMATAIGAGIIHMLVAYYRISIFEAEILADAALGQSALDMIRNDGFSLFMEGKEYTNNVLASLTNKLYLLYNIPTIGASGAVFGILLAFGMLFPNTELMLLFPPIPIKAKYFVILYGIFELYQGIANTPGDNVAHFAHLGGMLVGFILIRLWRKQRDTFY